MGRRDVATAAESADPDRLLLLFADERRGERMRTWVSERTDLDLRLRALDDPTVERVDLVVGDPGGVRRHADRIAARQTRAREQSATLPLLLVVPRGGSESGERERGVADLDAFEAEQGVRVHGTVAAPFREQTLDRRLASHLRTRRLSVELAESRERYRTLVEMAPEAILVFRESEIAYANRAAADLLAVEDPTGSDLASFVVPGQRSRLGAVRGRVAEGSPTGFAPVRLRVDGRTVEAELAGTPIRHEGGDTCQVMIRDVTHRNRSEERLRLYRRAMDDAPQAVTIADATADDLPIVYANEAFERITGYPAAEAVGRNCRFLQGPGTDAEAVAEIRAALDAREACSVELLNYRRDGTPFWNALEITPVEGAGGEITHFIGFQRDVTERRRRVRRLQVLDRVLRHNIRNGTNVLTGYASEVADRAEDPDVVRQAGRIHRAAEDLLALSDAARRFQGATEADGDSVGTLDLVPLLERALDGTIEAFPDAAVDADLPETAPVRANPSLELALVELLENAVCHNDADVPAVDVRIVEAIERVEVVITDDGPGVPEYVADIVAGRGESQTAHLQGIGLWTAIWAVQASGGEFDIDADGAGTVATVRVCRSDATPAECDRDPDASPRGGPDPNFDFDLDPGFGSGLGSRLDSDPGGE
jgi:PAS domain S-box-containing protein